MYDELVNLLRRCGKQKCKNCEYEHVLGCVTKMNEKAADAIEELQKQRDEWESHAALAESFARGWIPVTERLPYESVFVHGKGGELIVAQYSHKHKWWEDDEGYYCDTN